MKKLFTLLMTAATLTASAEGTGIYLSGTMNNWADADAAWELQAEPDMPGWAYIDLTDMPAGTEFRIKGHGRDFGMKNTRNIIKQNSLHLTTEGGSYNLTAGDEGLDGVHLMVLSEGFDTDRYGSIITRNAATVTLYGACMASSVTPVLLSPKADTPDIVTGEVTIDEPWYVTKAYQLGNATQSVTNYGLAQARSTQLVPTSFITPTAEAIPVPEGSAGTYAIEFDTVTLVYGIGSGSVGLHAVESDETSAPVYYNLHGIRVDNPGSGVFIMVKNGTPVKLVR